MVFILDRNRKGIQWMLACLRIALVMRLWPKKLSNASINSMGCFHSIYIRHQWIQLRVVDSRETLLLSREDCVRMLRLVRNAERRMKWRCPEPSEMDVRRNPSIHDNI